MAETVIVLANEFVFIRGDDGTVSTFVGPGKADKDKIVSYNPSIVGDDLDTFTLSEDAKPQRFVTAYTDGYVWLKHPARGNAHPQPGKLNPSAELEFGREIIIPGPCSFALYPWQEAEARLGYFLDKNEFLRCVCYDTSVSKRKMGEKFIVRGDETPFYIPESGTKVLGRKMEAAVLNEAQYCFLTDGLETRRIDGPGVIFPEPDEKFVTNVVDIVWEPFRIGEDEGILTLVTHSYQDWAEVEYAEQEDEDGNIVREPIPDTCWHYRGEKRFITRGDQAEFLPRPEISILSKSEAINIPAGMGIYVNDTRNGTVKTIKGPTKYLVNPLYETVRNPPERVYVKTTIIDYYTEGSEGYVVTAVYSRYIPDGTAICVEDENGDKHAVIGPKDFILGYGDRIIKIGDCEFFNLVTTYKDEFTVVTKDVCRIRLRVSYTVSANPELRDRWFNIPDIPGCAKDMLACYLSEVAVEHTLDELYNDMALFSGEYCCEEVIMNNGMRIPWFTVHDIFSACSVSDTIIDAIVASKKAEHEHLELVKKLTHDTEIAEKKKALKAAEAEIQKAEIRNQNDIEALLATTVKMRLDCQRVIHEEELEYLKKKNEIEVARGQDEASCRKMIIEAITPDLIAAITSASKHEALREICENIAPYALSSSGESVADVVNKLTRGTSLEGLIPSE